MNTNTHDHLERPICDEQNTIPEFSKPPWGPRVAGGIDWGEDTSAYYTKLQKIMQFPETLCKAPKKTTQSPKRMYKNQ